MSNKVLRAAVMAVLIALPTAAPAAVDYFLKISGIPGESKDSQHKDEIDIESWSFGVSNTTGGSAASRTKPCVSGINFTKLLDKASPPLMAKAVSGIPIPTAVLTGRTAGERPVEFLRIELQNVLVSSYSSGGSEASLPMESLSLNFERLKIEYKPQDPDGSPGGSVSETFPGGC